MTAYIDTVQEETLSSYPLTIQAQHLDMSTLLTTFMGQAESIEEHDKDAVYQKAMLAALINAVNNTEATENDLKAFKEYIENVTLHNVSLGNGTTVQPQSNSEKKYEVMLLDNKEEKSNAIMQARTDIAATQINDNGIYKTGLRSCRPVFVGMRVYIKWKEL